MTVKDIGELRINELERLLEGFSKNNKEQQTETHGRSKGSKKTLTDFEAIKYLMANKDAI